MLFSEDYSGTSADGLQAVLMDRLARANIPRMANVRWTMSITARSYNREIATKEHPRIVKYEVEGKFRIAG